MLRLLLHWVLSALALIIVAHVVPGFYIRGVGAALWAAVIIGTIAGFLVCFGVWFFDHVAHVDDPCGAISVHGVNGAWGVLATGLFADGTYGDKWNGVNGTVKGLFYGDAGQFLAQVAHVVLGFVWAFGVTFIIFKVARSFIRLRVSPPWVPVKPKKRDDLAWQNETGACVSNPSKIAAFRPPGATPGWILNI